MLSPCEVLNNQARFYTSLSVYDLDVCPEYKEIMLLPQLNCGRMEGLQHHY